MLLNDRFVDVHQANSTETFLAASIRFAQWLGFDYVAAMAVASNGLGEQAFVCVDNAPEAYAQIITPDRGRRDPVMQHCRHSSLPILWDQDTYTRVGKGDMWEQQAPFGYRGGIGVAIHMTGGRHVCVGVDRHQPLPSCREELARLAAHLQLFAVCAQERAHQLLLPGGPSLLEVLTSREREALKWTVEGKTAWEVGCILGISEQTAARHLHRATQKLDCVNKHQAAVRALRLGLIDF